LSHAAVRRNTNELSFRNATRRLRLAQALGDTCEPLDTRVDNAGSQRGMVLPAVEAGAHPAEVDVEVALFGMRSNGALICAHTATICPSSLAA
jgi:hypothetical protein